MQPTAPPRSALLAAWGAAWLAGDAGLPELLTRVTAHDDHHVVTGLDVAARDLSGPGPDLGGRDVTGRATAREPDRVGALPLDRAVARLRADGTTRLRVVLPAPGDAVGLPGPGAFSTAAGHAGEGVLFLRPDGTGTGLVPVVTAHGSPFDGTVTTVSWAAYAVAVPGPDPGPFLHDADHDLRRGVVDAAAALRDLDVARWRPEVATALQALRRQAGQGIDDAELPGGYPSRARDLLVRARQLGTVVSLALEDAGGAVDTRETVERERALRGLNTLVRRAQVAAYNSYGLR